MACNYFKLRKKIKEVFGTQAEFAKALGIGRVSLIQRLSGKSDFKKSEIENAVVLLGLKKSDITEYFFNAIV